MRLDVVEVGDVLTRTCGYLADVSSHTLQPYRGCALGSSLCGVGCYVRHNWYVTRGEAWGSFVDVRSNAAESYASAYERERRHARKTHGAFSIFMSSSTEPFQPAERKHGVTRKVLEAMLTRPPDVLIVQTHSPRVVDYLDIYPQLADVCALRFHLSIETDIERLPNLPRHASPVAKRFEAARQLREAGLRTVITVSPLLPMADPETFFARCADCADGVVIDHFIEGDGSATGSRTLRTALPAAMAALDPASVTLDYRNRMVDIARRSLPVGVSTDGFAGRLIA